MIKVGDQAPEVSLQDSSGKQIALHDYKGKWLVIYFYPKDDTPGCTVEACSFRDNMIILNAIGVDVIGISADNYDEHDKFINKHQLNYKLLSDPDKKVITAYNCWGKKMFGKEGILRKTFIINPEGRIAKMYGRVIPLNHATKVYEDIKSLQLQN